MSTDDQKAIASRYRELFTAFRFVVTGSSDEPLSPSLCTVYQDPFTSTVWLGKAHIAEEPTLPQQLQPAGSITAWLLSRDPTAISRQIVVIYTDTTYHPLNLDSARDDVALEWMGLLNACCSHPVDVPFEKLPDVLRNWLRRSPVEKIRPPQ